MVSCIRAIALAVVLLASIGARATNLTVTRTDDPIPNGCQPNDCSLREAVMVANALSGADRIILPAGIYQLTIAGATSDDASVGDLDIDTQIEIVGAGAASTTILGENSDRIFHVASSGGLALRHLTLDHGRDSSSNGGGAIWTSGALTIEDAVISGSQTTQNGGAILNSGNDETVLRRVQLLNNFASASGGAIYSGTSGVLLVDSIIRDNIAGQGGGIDGYAMRVYRSLIQHNSAYFGGGGIHGESQCACSSMEVHESTIAGNIAAYGSGIYAVYPFVIELSTLSGNTAENNGGAIYIDDDALYVYSHTAKVLSSTLYLNTASSGSGVYFHDSQTTPNFTVTFQNTLLSGTCVHQGAGINSLDGLLGNLESPGHTCGFGLNGSFSTSDVPPENLKLGALGDNGGPTPTHLPLAGSTAIGRGWSLVCEQLDQRGYVRTGCDVGSVGPGALDDVIFRTGYEY